MIRKLAGLCVSDKRKSLLYEVIALAKLVDSLMDQVAAYFVKAVSKIVELFCMVAVVAQHIGEKSQGFFRGRSRRVTV